jgi:hypothetical protein
VFVTCGGYVDALIRHQTDVTQAVKKIQPADIPY